MQKLNTLGILAIIFIAICSFFCQKSFETEMVANEENIFSKKIVDFKVSTKDVLSLAGKFLKNPTKSSGDIELTPVTDGVDTTGYVVNMPDDEGWMIGLEPINMYYAFR